MFLLRSYTEANEFPERSGTRLIIAQRFSNTYKLRFMHYGKKLTRVRVFGIEKSEFEAIMADYGVLISHTRRMSEYLLVQNRRLYTIWTAQNKNVVRLGIVCPNNREEVSDSTLKIIRQLGRDKTKQAYPVEDWTVHYFQINREELKSILH